MNWHDVDGLITKAVAPHDFYTTLHRIADKAAPDLAESFVRTVQEAVDHVDQSTLERAIATGDVAHIYQALNLNGNLNPALKAQFAAELSHVFSVAMVATIRPTEQVVSAATPASSPEPSIRADMSFNLINPAAVQYAATRVGNMITDVSQPNGIIAQPVMNAVRDIVGRGFADGNTTKTMATEIRQVVGLNDRQAKALLRFRRTQMNTLRQKHPKTPETKLQARVDEKAERYHDKLLRERASMIARTETMTASTAGRRMLWREATSRGVLRFAQDLPLFYATPYGPLVGPIAHPRCRCAEIIRVVNGLARRFWLVTEDDRLCRNCRAIPKMNPDGVGLGSHESTDFMDAA